MPAGIVLSHAGRGTVTDLRFSSYTLPAVPAGRTTDRPLTSWRRRCATAQPGDPASDVYTAGAVLYYAVTGTEPALDPTAIRRPSELRPTCPRTLERIILRALRAEPDRRYLSAGGDAGGLRVGGGRRREPVSVRPAGAQLDTSADHAEEWEKRLRRALGDDYELLDTVGAGGFGRVYRVRDLHLEREVALKVLHPALTRDLAGVERFRREAQLAAKLQHPNIVDIYDIAGALGAALVHDGTGARAQPGAAGASVRGRSAFDRVIRLLREALCALAHAHALGLVHRDIKPENMLIAPGGSLKITDFGLALALRGGRFGGATSQSGTPQFASPEQLLGERVDQRTDLYSLAAVAYFALLGHPPFEGVTPEQVLARQTTDQAARPARRRARRGSEALARRARARAAERGRPALRDRREFLQALNRVTRGGRIERALDTLRWRLGSPRGRDPLD